MPEYGEVIGAYVVQAPRRGAHGDDAVFGREILEVAAQGQYVFVVRVYVEKPRRPGQHRLDVLLHEPLAQDGGVGHRTRECGEGLLVLGCADGAQQHQIGGLLPVVAALLVETAYVVVLAGEAFVAQRVVYLGTVERVE